MKSKTIQEPKQKEQKVNITPLKIGVLKLKIVGKTDYMPEPMDEAVLERYNKLKSNQVAEKDSLSEEEKVKVKYYYTADGKKGIPSRAFYNAMIRASSYFFDISMGGMRNFKEGVNVPEEILPLTYKSEKVLEHWGRMSGRTRAPRKILRNAFKDWSCNLTIEFDQVNLSAEQIINVLNYAGFKIGVGAFRKEKSGNYGSFSVELK